MSLALSANTVSTIFRERFESTPTVVRSPGRINLIGEHTDYNNGYVLPAAIDKAVYVAISRSRSETITLYSAEFNERIEVNISELMPSKTHPWTNYILGVVDQLKKRNYPVSGFNLVISGDIPLGAGLSSSAAVECATAFALNEVFELNISRLDLVKLSQQAEHEFAGVKCGIMDQFASVFGKNQHAIRLDCRSLAFDYIPLSFSGLSVVLFDTQVKHSLASSAYNKRREECEEAAARIQQKYPQVQSLRDCTSDIITEVLQTNSVLYKRAHYVVSEIERVIAGCHDLAQGNIHAFGQKMFLSHEGLKNHYEVSCAELDFLIDQVKENTAVIGARMMGGGFGGCTINLIKNEEVNAVISQLQQAYQSTFTKSLQAYPVSVEDGTSVISS